MRTRVMTGDLFRKTLLPSPCMQVTRITARVRFLYLGIADLWRWMILCYGGYLVQCMMSKTLPGLYPLDAS